MKTIKKKFTFLVFCIFSLTIVKAQTPSLDLENWFHTQETTSPVPSPAYDQPNGWTTSNVLTVLGNAVSITKVADAHSGSAARIETIKINNNPVPNEIPDTAGIMFTGSISVFTKKINYGFPYGERAEKLKFYCKYAPNGVDTAHVVVVMSRWNSLAGTSDEIGYGKFNISSATTNYALSEITINYNPSIAWVNPDSATIVVSSSGLIKPKIGSVFFVDDFSFTAPNGILSSLDNNNISTFPNPVNSSLSFSFLPSGAEKIEIMDITGKTLDSYPVKQDKALINTVELAPGIYLFTINGKQEVFKRGKFIKN